jgi:hypothetical protein
MNLQSHLRDDEFGEDRIKQYFEFMVKVETRTNELRLSK